MRVFSRKLLIFTLMKTFTKNKRSLLFVLLFLSSISLHAQTIKNPTDSTINPSDTTILTKLEQDAEFPNGQGAWAQYLGRNIDADIPARKKAPVGSYQVIIRFIIDKDGNVTDLVPETNFGYGMEEEVMRVLKNSPPWTPAFQNGRNVNAYKRQPITFRVSGQ